MPFGIKSAPVSFQRIVNTVLAGFIGSSAHVYLDDIIIQGKSFDDHFENLTRVLDRLQKAKLKLKVEKCDFFKTEIAYLGHIISTEGLKPQSDKIQAIKKIAEPKNIQELQSFLGLMNYYRKFIKDFSEISRPLTVLLAGKKGPHKKADKTPIAWSETTQTAFTQLKDKLTEEVTLKFPDFSYEFLLTTDASTESIGGVLQQEDETGRVRPLTFFSRALNTAERRYSAIEREALAIEYGLQVNRPLCLGYHIEIHTDHRPLVWLLKVASPNGRIARWQTLLSEYDFGIKYIPGKDNIVADFLSRMKRQEETELVDPRDRIMIVGDARIDNQEGVEWNLEETRKLQDANEAYLIAKKGIESGKSLKEIRDELKIKRCNIKLPLEELQVEEGMLYRHTKSPYEEPIKAVVLTPEYVPKAIHLAHSVFPAGHGGVKVTLNRCQKLAFWPGMKKDVEEYCRKCQVCCRFKSVGNLSLTPLRRHPDVSAPFERIHMDIVGPMGTSDKGNKYILIIIDVFTRYLVTVLLKSKEASEVARAFFNQVVCVHGIPKTVVTDQGKEFVNQIFKGVTERLQVNHATITAYRPSANGVIERTNYTVVNILRTLTEDNPNIWDEMLPSATYAYNSAYHRIIKDSPFYLLHLRDPSIPHQILDAPPKPWYNVD